MKPGDGESLKLTTTNTRRHRQNRCCILGPIIENAVRVFTISTCASGLLVIALDGFLLTKSEYKRRASNPLPTETYSFWSDWIRFSTLEAYRMMQNETNVTLIDSKPKC